VIVCTALAYAAIIAVPGFAADNDWKAEVGKALGQTGVTMPGGV
jgi:hypothetical protein